MLYENSFWIVLSVGVATYQSGFLAGLFVLSLWGIAYQHDKNSSLRMGLKVRPRYFVKPYPEPYQDKALDSYEFSINEAAIDIARHKYLTFCHIEKITIFRDTPKNNCEVDGGYEIFIDDWFKDAEPIYFSTFDELNGLTKYHAESLLKKARKESLPARNYYLNQFKEYKKRWLNNDPKFPSAYELLYWINPDCSY